MPYTLITANGKIKLFYIKGVAEMYQIIDGGVIITNTIFEEPIVVETEIL